MIKVAVCDDDELQREEAVAMLEEFASSRRLDVRVSAFGTTEDFLADGNPKQFDIVFMDIEFEGKPEGIDAVRRTNELAPNCQVVYLTNYLQYSVDVYRTDHVWFVRKNQLKERLPEVLEKFERIDEARRQFFVVSTRENGLAKIPCKDILYLERQTRISRIVCRTAEYEASDKLSVLMEKLPQSVFAFCHSSFIVNMPSIVELHDFEVVLENGERLPISRRYAKSFRQRYFEWADQWTV